MGNRNFGMGVWGYAPTREVVTVIFILSFTHVRGGRARWRDSRLRLPLTFTERATRSTWWRISRPITSRSSRCCRRILPAPTMVGVSQGYAPRPFASVTHTIYGRWPSGVRGYALSGGHQTVHSVWGYTCRAFRLPNHTLSPTYSESRYCNVEPVFGGLWARNVSIGGRAVADRKRGNEIVLSNTTH